MPETAMFESDPIRNRGYVFKRGRTYWVQYSVDGVRVRESCKSPFKQAAKALLRKRLAEIDNGIAQPAGARGLAYDAMRNALYEDYKINGKRWLRTGKDGKQYVVGISNLDNFFNGWRALRITTKAIRKYIRARQEQGAAAGTINREMALLRRMFSLAVADKELNVNQVPHFPMLQEAAARKGFLEHRDYVKLRQELPEHLRPVLAVGYYTGMRLGEIIALRWDWVSLMDGEIRLPGDATKSKKPRTVPLAPEPLKMLQIVREKDPTAERVFLDGDGKPVQTFYKAWRSATKRAGLKGLLFHDLRRTGVRNLVRAGVPQSVAMKISGHKTREVFDRYDIVSNDDLRDAAERLDSYLKGQFSHNPATISTEAETERSRNQQQVSSIQ